MCSLILLHLFQPKTWVSRYLRPETPPIPFWSAPRSHKSTVQRDKEQDTLNRLCYSDRLGNSISWLLSVRDIESVGNSKYLATAFSCFLRACGVSTTALVSSFSFRVRIVLKSKRMPLVTWVEQTERSETLLKQHLSWEAPRFRSSVDQSRWRHPEARPVRHSMALYFLKTKESDTDNKVTWTYDWCALSTQNPRVFFTFFRIHWELSSDHNPHFTPDDKEAHAAHLFVAYPISSSLP